MFSSVFSLPRLSPFLSFFFWKYHYYIIHVNLEIAIPSPSICVYLIISFVFSERGGGLYFANLVRHSNPYSKYSYETYVYLFFSSNQGLLEKLLIHARYTFLSSESQVKDKVEFWSCDCIVKEKVWNGSEKVDHVACPYWCLLQGFGVIKIIIKLALSL